MYPSNKVNVLIKHIIVNNKIQSLSKIISKIFIHAIKYMRIINDAPAIIEPEEEESVLPLPEESEPESEEPLSVLVHVPVQLEVSVESHIPLQVAEVV